jgi:hypothetical protein
VKGNAEFRIEDGSGTKLMMKIVCIDLPFYFFRLLYESAILTLMGRNSTATKTG